MGGISNDARAAPLLVQLPGGEDIDEADLDEMTRSLRSELEELSFVRSVDQRRSVEPGETSPPKGTKAGEILTLGALALAILPDALPTLIGFLKEWALRPGNRPVKIKVQRAEHSLEVEYDPRSMSTAEVKDLASEMHALLDTERPPS